MLAPALLNDVSPVQKLWGPRGLEDSLSGPWAPADQRERCCCCCYCHQLHQTPQPWSLRHLNGQTGPRFLWSGFKRCFGAHLQWRLWRSWCLFLSDRCLTFSSGRLSVAFSPVLPSSAGGVRPGGGQVRVFVLLVASVKMGPKLARENTIEKSGFSKSEVIHHC